MCSNQVTCAKDEVDCNYTMARLLALGTGVGGAVGACIAGIAGTAGAITPGCVFAIFSAIIAAGDVGAGIQVCSTEWSVVVPAPAPQ
jgi:hypothetical protein